MCSESPDLPAASPAAAEQTVAQSTTAVPYPPYPPHPGYGYWPPPPPVGGYVYGTPGPHPYPFYPDPASAGQHPPPYGYAAPCNGTCLPPSAGQPLPGGGQQGMNQGSGRGVGLHQLVRDVATGGNVLDSVVQFLDLDDADFWKGALLGAAGVLLLTNGTVQQTLFSGRRTAPPAPADGQA